MVPLVGVVVWIVQDAHQALFDGKVYARVVHQAVQDLTAGLLALLLVNRLVQLIEQSDQYLVLLVDFLDADTELL